MVVVMPPKVEKFPDRRHDQDFAPRVLVSFASPQNEKISEYWFP